jgi:PrtD family type I secretion system ABC transporter
LEERSLIAGCRLGLAAVALFSLAINILMLTSAFYMFQVFDRVLSSRSGATLFYLTLIALIALAALGLLEMIRTRLLVRIGGWIERRLSLPVLTRSIDAANAGQSVGTQRLFDLGQIRSFLSGPGILALFDLPWLPVYLLALYLLHPYLGHFALVGAALLLALALLNERVTHRALKEANSRTTAVQRRAEGMVRNAGVVDGLGMMSGLARRWLDAFGDSQTLRLVANERSGAVLAMSKFLRAGLQIVILGLGAHLVIAHEITAGAMIAASILLGRALAPIEQANANLRQAVSAWDAARRVRSFLRAPPRRREAMALPAPAGHLEVSGLSFAFRSGSSARPRPILSGVSFLASPGELVAVIGPSASGKSTLARLLVGILAPDAGTVRLDGADLFAWSRADLGSHVGYLPQELELFSGTVKDNIARMGEPDPAAVAMAAQLAGCHEMILRLPEGYDTEIGDGGLYLSGGQRQRIALARAFYGNPRLLVLDEPDASLDGEGDAALGQALAHAKARGCTVIVIAHRPNILARADQILLLRDGRVDLFGPRAEVAAELGKRASAAPRHLQPVATTARIAAPADPASRSDAGAAE